MTPRHYLPLTQSEFSQNLARKSSRQFFLPAAVEGRVDQRVSDRQWSDALGHSASTLSWPREDGTGWSRDTAASVSLGGAEILQQV